MKLSIWDIAAGILLIKEAGGMCTNFEGGEDFSSGDIIAGGEKIYKILFDIVNKRG